MGWITGIAVYAIIWWLTLFMVLPFGVRRQDDGGAGHDPGAPKRAMILRKMVINTILAAAVFGVVYLIDIYDIVSFDDFRAPSSGRGGTF